MLLKRYNFFFSYDFFSFNIYNMYKCKYTTCTVQHVLYNMCKWMILYKYIKQEAGASKLRSMYVV